jgi:hypothetical protein
VSEAERLCAFAMHTYGARMTQLQIRSAWTYLRTASGELTGVVVPADGNSASILVTVADMRSGQQAFT